MVKAYDLVVLGSGSAGTITAKKCKEAGWSVAILDNRPFGGTCSQRGCDPKKVLVGAAELIDWNRRMDGLGIVDNSSINWQQLMAFKRQFTEPIPERTEIKYEELGIDLYSGKGEFQSETEIRVGSDVLKANYILIATGAHPVKMGIKGEEFLSTSDDFLDLDELPKRFVFVGGGFISFEFAHIAARAGAEVHIIHRGKQPLKQFDEDMVNILLKRTKELGIQVHLETSVEAIEKRGNTFTVIGKRSNEKHEFSGDIIVHGAGREPALDIELEKGNVERDKQGVKVNDYLQSVSNPHVYAAGDVASTDGPPLTPVATVDSHTVTKNILKGNQKTIDYPVIPSVVFTVPKAASVGMTEQEAIESGLDIHINFKDVSDSYTYKRTNERYAAYKVIIDKKNEIILGAHLISGEADELINHFATMIQLKIPLNDIKKMVFAYPTAASDISRMI